MEDYLNLDFMTLEGISRQSGVPIDRVVYLESLKSAQEKGCLFDVWRGRRAPRLCDIERHWRREMVRTDVCHPSLAS